MALLAKVDGVDHIFQFNPLTGAAAPGIVATKLSYEVVSATILPLHDNSFTRILALLDSSNEIHIIPSLPSTKAAVAESTKPIYFQTIDTKAGSVNGYIVRTKDAKFIAEKLTQVAFDPATETIAAVGIKRNERVASIGETLDDRTVMFKYLNPHVVAVATLSNYTKNVATLNVYVIDGIRGVIIDQVSHEGVQGPIHLAHAENWVVYHYNNRIDRRHEVGVLEMYESDHKTVESESISAYAHPTPFVLRQAYVLPSAVTAMGVTTTLNGITHKQILIAVPSGSLIALHKRMVSSRRPMDPKPTEDMLMPYTPMLPFTGPSAINYNHTAARVRGFATYPSGLESTTLAFAYGVDVFFSPVMPSKQFDMLNDDFSFVGLVVSLIALSIACIIASRVTEAKAVKALWL